MKSDEAQAAVTKYGSQNQAAKALGISRYTIQMAMKGSGAQTAKQIAIPQKTVESVVQGFALKDVRTSDHKPADNVKRLLYQLRQGRGFPIDKQAEAWGISVDSLRKQAKRIECLKYVETEPGNWVLCVMHPDTAVEYRKETT